MTPEAINYRVAANPQQSCANCGNAVPGPQGLMCNVLQMPVQPQMVSDSWMPAGAAQGQAAAGAGAAPPMDLAALMGPPQTGGAA
jgi:hypothetical protein